MILKKLWKHTLICPFCQGILALALFLLGLALIALSSKSEP